MLMALFLSRPADGFGWLNLVYLTAGYLVAFLLFKAGKKYITIPRLGQVTFGRIRKQRNRTMSIILGVFIFFQILLLITTALALVDPRVGNWFNRQLAGKNELLLVSLIASLILCVSMSVVAYFQEFTRGYYIAIMMAVAVFLILFLEQPIFPILVGLLIIIPGLVLLLRFLKKYPLPKKEVDHD